MSSHHIFRSDEEVFEYLSHSMLAGIGDFDASCHDARDYVQSHRGELDGRLEAAFHWLTTHEYPPGILRDLVSRVTLIIADDDADARELLEDLRTSIFDP